MRVQRILGTLVGRFETTAGSAHLRRLACVGAIVVGTYFQSNVTMADGGAVAAGLTGVPPFAAGIDFPPKIVNFSASRSNGNFWVVSGIVIDDNTGGVTVQLGGYLQNVIVHPAADGSFSYIFYLPPGQFAYIAALATDDDDGEYSQPAELYVMG